MAENFRLPLRKRREVIETLEKFRHQFVERFLKVVEVLYGYLSLLCIGGSQARDPQIEQLAKGVRLNAELEPQLPSVENAVFACPSRMSASPCSLISSRISLRRRKPRTTEDSSGVYFLLFLHHATGPTSSTLRRPVAHEILAVA